jgi:hypothetical protein
VVQRQRRQQARARPDAHTGQLAVQRGQGCGYAGVLRELAGGDGDECARGAPTAVGGAALRRVREGLPQGVATDRRPNAACACAKAEAAAQLQWLSGACWLHTGRGGLVAEACIQAGGCQLRLCGRLRGGVRQVRPKLPGVSRVGAVPGRRLLRAPPCVALRCCGISPGTERRFALILIISTVPRELQVFMSNVTSFEKHPGAFGYTRN